jgi:dCMP deaminase
MLINAGIEKIYFLEGYPDKLADEMIAEAGIEIERLKV